MPDKSRKEIKQDIIDLFNSPEGLEKLKKSGVSVLDDFDEVLPFERIMKNITYSKISPEDFEESFGEEWVHENWTSLLEILHANAEPDCFVVTVADAKGNKILSAYVNGSQLFGTLEYKQSICATVAKSIFRTLYQLPTHREVAKALESGDEDTIEFIKSQFNYFKDDPRNSIILDLIKQHSPKLRRLIEEKVGY